MNMSFMLTVPQMKARTKTVTRRLGWKNLKPGAIVTAIVKGQGLKKGEKIEKLYLIRIKSNRAERLDTMLTDKEYGFDEIEREGFREHPTLCWPTEFVNFFCNSHKGCTPETIVNRIEFEEA